MSSSNPPGRSLWISVGVGLLVSVITGTIVMIVAYDFSDLGTFIGAFLGGLLAGQIILKPPIRAAYAGILSAFLSFMSYFQVVPFLIDAQIIPQSQEPPPDTTQFFMFVAVYLGIFLLLGGAGGIVGGYLRSRTHPQAVIPGRCANCGAVVPGVAIFCPYCGRRVRQSDKSYPEW